MSEPLIGELFAGYGGLGMAVQDVYGGKLAWYSEFDDAPSRIMAHHHPGVPNYGDVTAIDWDEIPRVDILTGGYPCQPFSLAGRRGGASDDRHLWPSVVEAVNTLRPALCLFENVQGHLSLGFDIVLSDLKALGYEVAWTLVSVASVGAPHRRNRLFILATRSDHDGIDGLLRSWADRRRGLHRDHLHPHDSIDPVEDHDGRQGTPRSASHGIPVRGNAGTRADREGDDARDVDLAHPRGRGGEPDRETALGFHREGGGRSDRTAVPGDAGLGTQTPERTGEVDRGHHGSSPVLREADPGSEPEGAGPGPAGSADRGDNGRRGDVGATRGSVRPGGVPGEAANDRDDALWAALFTPLAYGDVDLGAFPADADRSGLERVGRIEPVEHDARGRSSPHEVRDGAEPPALTLLPTPRATDGTKGGPNQAGSSGDLMLPSAVQPERFGPYAPAIQRWERVLGRPAPAPTEPGKNRPRLASRFVEWLMGLPDGHVTDVGLTRNQELKALGNGVMPQQGAAALRHLDYIRRTT